MSSVSSSDPSATASDALPSPAEWRQLDQGKVVLRGQQGRYAVMGIAQVEQALAWSTLTDYGSFHQFLPTVTASRVVESDGQRSIVEQIDRRRILMSMVESTIRTENVEMDDNQISFRLLEGNLKYMYGHWRLEPVTRSQPVAATLVSQWVTAEADLGPFKKMFYKLFEASLIDTMAAICGEMERRSASQSAVRL
jgi:ribosome-associated toxin RatA of RatAB toxin-antitoxin module